MSFQSRSSPSRSPTHGTSPAICARNASMPAALHRIERALADDVRALPVVATIEHDQHLAEIYAAPALRRIAGAA